MQYVIGIITVLVGGVLYLFNQNQKLKSNEKISETKIEDAKLETKQDVIVEKISEVKSDLSKLTEQPVNDKQTAEDFWSKRGDK
jgi:hypothetical protein